MKLIAGLGNPGRRYAESRHNVGYMVVDELARRTGLETDRLENRFEAFVADGPVAGQRTLLVKPVTYMNLSGRAVAAVMRFYKIAIEDVLVIYDELDLPLGKLRVRESGSAGGHKGMADVLRHVGDPARIRVGIGKVNPAATVDYVLSKFFPEERETAELMLKLAADAAECWLRSGTQTAMNEFNRRDASAGAK